MLHYFCFNRWKLMGDLVGCTSATADESVQELFADYILIGSGVVTATAFVLNLDMEAFKKFLESLTNIRSDNIGYFAKILLHSVCSKTNSTPETSAVLR